MSDNWPTAFIEITVNNGLLPKGDDRRIAAKEDPSRNLVTAIKQLVPLLHEKITDGHCRIMLRDVSFSDCCVADVTRFISSKSHTLPSYDPIPHDAVIISIVAPRKDKSNLGLSGNDVQSIGDSIKDLLQKDPYKIDRKNVIVVPSLSDTSLSQKANK